LKEKILLWEECYTVYRQSGFFAACLKSEGMVPPLKQRVHVMAIYYRYPNISPRRKLCQWVTFFS